MDNRDERPGRSTSGEELPSRDALLNEQQARWSRGEWMLVEEYLERFPVLRGEIELVLDLIDHEFLLREEAGDPPKFDEYVQRFPWLESHLRIQFALHSTLGPNTGETIANPVSTEKRTLVETAISADIGNLPVNDDSPSDEGRQIGPYRLIRLLGSGGMGVVYEAEDPKLNRRIALKLMKPHVAEQPSARQRFLREAQAAAAIEHDHIVTIYQVGEEDGWPYLAMQLLQGETLEERLQREQLLRLPELLRISIETAQVIAAAHAVGLLHRDIKPRNIWLERNRDRVKVLDFGLARVFDSPSDLTQSGMIVGTPAYIAPEQLAENRAIPAGDLFGLGAVMYRAATGRTAFEGPTVMAILAAISQQTPPPPRELNPQLPESVSSLILQLIEKDPDKRPASAAAVVETLERIRAGQTVKGTSKELPRTVPRRWGRRLIVAIALLLAAVGWWSTPALIRIAFGEGTLSIQSEVDDIQVIVEGNGNVRLIDPHRNSSFRLRPGKYHIRLSEERSGLRLDTQEFTIRRNGEQTVRVWLQPEPVPPIPGDEAPSIAENSGWTATAEQQKFFDEVAMLPAISQIEAVANKMQDINPGFDGEILPKIEGGRIVGLSFQSDNVRNLWPLRALPHLEKLSCVGSHRSMGRISDLSPLAGMPLVELNCARNRIHDLRPLAGMPLEKLTIGTTGVSDLSPLAGMPLHDLNAGGSRISDLAPLSETPLTNLNVNNTRVADLTPLSGMALEQLNVAYTPVSDLSPLAGMPLVVFSCTDTPVSDLSPLTKTSLKVLWCDKSGVSDLSPLTEMSLNSLCPNLLLFHPADEERLRSLGKEVRLCLNRPFRHSEVFWQDVEQRRQAVEKFVETVGSLAPEKQASAIVERLRELNSDSTIEFTPVIRDGMIVEATVTLPGTGEAPSRRFPSEPGDITPIRALTGLKQLTIVGGPHWLDLSSLNTLPLESLTSSKAIVQRNAPVLEAMDTLTLVNGQRVDR